ncbi:hypothetical protein [Pedobacter sandarakinus]|uniref:hypothetical protein n=1 Tax=Pedobacter sandarakinus TaxID=353156 RepID=UPI0022463C7D|nr:hypothetical protein [Pedobacter sandarakinus]MCX2574823.1 hypothetical protein [Pedobacter sandarakinus]
MKNQTKNLPRNSIKIMLAIITLILLVPLVAMQFTAEVKWTLSDFFIAALLLLSSGFAIVFVLNKVKTGKMRTILLMIILLALFLIWAELAVGVFDSPLAGN